jgi:hypothetical protein
MLTQLCTYLVKNGSIWANEAPFEHLLFAIGISDWVTNVENLALISHVSIVTVRPCITCKLVNYVLPN